MLSAWKWNQSRPCRRRSPLHQTAAPEGRRPSERGEPEGRRCSRRHPCPPENQRFCRFKRWPSSQLTLSRDATFQGFKCLFTYSFKSSFVLGQLLLTENAILCQKVNCKEKTKRNPEILQDCITSGCSDCTRATFQDGRRSFVPCFTFYIMQTSHFHPERQH